MSTERGPGTRPGPILLLALLSCLVAACGAGAPERPNVVMLVMDTTRADRCSFVGYSRPTTPFLDRLAQRGVVYTNAWSPSSWTAPSHASFFTGLRPEHHGLMHDNRPFLKKETRTLATILGENGYRTACLTNNTLISPGFGLTRGFETYETIVDREEPGYPTACWAHDLAAEWVEERQRKGQRFFLFVNDMEPHAPYTPLQPHQDRLVTPGTSPAAVSAGRAFGGVDAVFRHLFGGERIPDRMWPTISDLYDAEIATLDAEIGNLLDRLEGMGALEDTVLVVLGDHGENLGDHGLGSHVLSLHRSLLHVPLLVVAPEGFPAGAVESAVVRLEDLFPTLLATCGLPVPDGIDGEDMRAVAPGRIARAILGRALNQSLLKDFPGIESDPFLLPRRSVFDGRMHLIVRQDGQTELYDLASDPEEREDLAGREPGEVERLTPLLPVR